MKKVIALVGLCVVMAPSLALAQMNDVEFKSPGTSGMHFTQGMPMVVYGTISDARNAKGYIVCPPGQMVSNYYPEPPCYNNPNIMAQCSGGTTPVGWPQFQIMVDGAIQTDLFTSNTTVASAVTFNADNNPDPGQFYPFKFDTTGLPAGSHQIVIHAFFSADGVTITTQDSAPMTFVLDPVPAMQMVTLNADMTGPVNWDHVVVIGNGHAVTANGALVIRNSLVTGLSGLSGMVDSVDMEASTFEDSGSLTLTIGGAVTVTGNEFRANNRLTFLPSDPDIPVLMDLEAASADMHLFQTNRIAAGIVNFGGQNWLIGGDTDAQSNIFLGPRCVYLISSDHTVIRGNYGHHVYRDDWSQGYNFDYFIAGSDVLTEHNFLRNGSWPVQSVSGEFRYNVVYGYGHNWIRSPKANTIIHHNIFTPGGNIGLSAGIQDYQGETGIVIYNNTFDGGGDVVGDFAGGMTNMSCGAQVTSIRNNLFTYSRNQENDNPGSTQVIGGATAYLYADYNAFYSPDNTNQTNYDFAGPGAHDLSGTGAVGVLNGQLATSPFAAARVYPIDDDSIVDEPAVWAGTQTVSQILALFRAHYTPTGPVVNAGDPQDTDAQGRPASIGAVGINGNSEDQLGMFGSPPAETVPPTVTLTAPTAGATLTGVVTLSATAMDNPGGSGVALVQFLVDGTTVGQTAASPYSVSFDTSSVANGSHMFAAKAWDAAGNFALSATVTAQVSGNIAPDAGITPTDGGTHLTPDGGVVNHDGGATSDARSDARADAAGDASGDAGGGGVVGACNCTVPGMPHPSALLALVALSGALTFRRRRPRGHHPGLDG